MAKILGYIATSLDGFIAAPNDNLDWLAKYADLDFGKYDYNLFLSRIRTVVMGRGTYDFVAQDPDIWPYRHQRVIVVTSRPIDNPIADIEIRSDVDSLISELRNINDGDVWMVGGGQLQMSFIERQALDELEIYVMPELIGGGRPLFPSTGYQTSPKLLSVQVLEEGCVRMHYALTGAQA